MDTFPCSTAPRDACSPFLRPSAYSLALKSGPDYGTISMRLQCKIISKMYLIENKEVTSL